MNNPQKYGYANGKTIKEMVKVCLTLSRQYVFELLVGEHMK